MPAARKRSAKSTRSTDGASVPTGDNQSAPARRKILVADPQPEICDLVQEYLSGEGYFVSAVGTSDDLLAVTAENDFDLIIMEIQFPDTDGLSIIRMLRQRTSIPIILLTARGEIVDRILGLEMGADDYLSKPFHLRELHARISSVMRRSGVPALKPKIERVITFKPEHYQAGLQILSYFHTIVAKKYPNNQATVSIHQVGNSIKLIIETEHGEQEMIEQVLDDYADVVFGRKPPETLLSDTMDVMELRYKLDLASAELRLHRQLYDHTKEQYQSRIGSLEDQVKILNKSLYLGMSREQKLVNLIDKLSGSTLEKSASEALRVLQEKLKAGVTETDEETIKKAAATLSNEKRIFGQILGICRDIVSRSGGHLLSEWVVGIANSLPR